MEREENEDGSSQCMRRGEFALSYEGSIYVYYSVNEYQTFPYRETAIITIAINISIPMGFSSRYWEIPFI